VGGPGHACLFRRIRRPGAKMVTVLPWNPRAHLPAVQAMVFLLMLPTVLPWPSWRGLTLPFRTGAPRRSHAGPVPSGFPLSGRIRSWRAIVFSGERVLAARKIGLIKVFDLLPEKADELIAGLRGDASCRGIELLRAEPHPGSGGADIVVTATTSTRPVFEGKLLREGMHINAIGAFKPRCRRWMRRPSAGREFLWIPWKPVWRRPGPDHSPEERPDSRDRHPGRAGRSGGREKAGKGVGSGDYLFQIRRNAVQDVPYPRPCTAGHGRKIWDKRWSCKGQPGKGS